MLAGGRKTGIQKSIWRGAILLFLPKGYTTEVVTGNSGFFRNHTIFRLDTHLNLTYLCAVTFNNNDYGKRKSKLPGGI